MHAGEVASRYDAVVIGSGHNGLVAAAYLAKAGKSVLVVERSAELGGATSSQRVFPDYEAYLSRYAYLVSLFPDRIVQDLGLRFQTKRRQTGSFTAFSGDDGSPQGFVLSNVDPARNEAAILATAGEGAWSRYQAFLSLERALAKKAWPSMLEPLRAKADFEAGLASSEEREAWRSFVEEPLGRAIERYADHDALRGLLLTDAKIGVFTHAHDPSLLQNRCFLYHVIGGGDGEWRVPVGGMRAIVEALLEVGRAHGVDYRTGADACRIVPGPEYHTVALEVESGGIEVQARNVLVNAGPSAFTRLVGEPAPEQGENEGSVVKINMLLRRLPQLKSGVAPKEAFCGSFHFDEGYAQMQRSYETAADGTIPDPAPGEIYCHTLTDPSILSPELQAQGFHTLTLFGLDMPYRLFTSDREAKRAEVRRRYLEGLDRVCAEPFEDCLALDKDGAPCLEVKLPQDLEEEVGLDRGNIFHTAPSWFYAERPEDVGRWGVETAYPRIYRAGSSAHRGGAVSGIPGYAAARCVLDDIL